MYERQRVWRACQACRRKKVKCDGEHPCQSCNRNKVDCVFEPYSNMRLVDPQYVMKLEKRLEQMEKNLKVQSAAQMSTARPVQPPSPSPRDGHFRDQDEPRQFPMVPTSDEGVLSDPPHCSRTRSADRGLQPTEPSSLQDEILGEFDSHIQEDDDYEIFVHRQDGGEHATATTSTRAISVGATQLAESLIQALIDLFYRSIYPIFPIIHIHNFQQQYDRWLSDHENTDKGNDDDDFSFLLYALLAAAASIIPKEHPIFDQEDCQIYKEIDLGNLLYSHASSFGSGRPYQRSTTSAINTVAGHGILSLYLTETGRANDAWVTAGHAMRLYQGLDMDDDCNDDTTDSSTSFPARSNLWWCLYILDRSLSTALLKPLAIDDTESDTLSFDDEDHQITTLEATDPWFSAVAEFHVKMGRIYRSVRWIRKFQPSHNPKMRDTLRSYVKKHDAELEEYYNKQVLPKIDRGDTQLEPIAMQTIAVSSYYIGVVLLYRTFIERLNFAEPETFLRCAEAASNCIRVTPEVIARVPASHFVIQQSRAMYASTKVLLHCMRLAQNPTFTNKAWPDVESGFNMLRDIKIQWPEINKYQSLIQKDMELTQMTLNKQESFHRAFAQFGQFAISQRPSGIMDQAYNTDSHCPDHVNTEERPATRVDIEKMGPLQNDMVGPSHSVTPADERPQKRRKFLPNASASNRLPERNTPNAAPDYGDYGGYLTRDQIVTDDDLLLGDLISQPSALGDPLNLFGDTILMSSVDQFFSQYED